MVGLIIVTLATPWIQQKNDERWNEDIKTYISFTFEKLFRCEGLHDSAIDGEWLSNKFLLRPHYF